LHFVVESKTIKTAMFQDFAAYHLAPYALWQKAAAGRSLHWRDDFFGGAWVLSDYALCEQVLRDDERFSAARTGGWVGSVSDADDAISDETTPATGHKAFQRLFARAMLFVDAPQHQRLRGIMQPFFKPSELEKLRAYIEHTVAERCSAIEAASAQGQAFDWIAQFARPLPAAVIVRFLGLQYVDAAEQAKFMQWSRDLAIFIGVPVADKNHWRAAQRSILQMAAFFKHAFEQNRVAAGSLLARLGQALSDGEMDEAELIAQSAMLLFAGHETTRHLLGTSVLRLLENPAQWQLLQSQPALAPKAVRELLRLEPPVQYTGRRARADFEFAGQQIKRNDLVLACIAAAHRDEQRYPDAEQLNINRASVASLAFGSGAHVCIGAALTQMEAEITLSHISARWPHLRLADTKNVADWDHSNLAYRGLNTLLLTR
jgi:hypothetical protein